jgi:hypothetical protein
MKSSQKEKRPKNIAYVSWRCWNVSLGVEKLFGRHFSAFLERFIVTHVSQTTALFTICQDISP